MDYGCISYEFEREVSDYGHEELTGALYVEAFETKPRVDTKELADVDVSHVKDIGDRSKFGRICRFLYWSFQKRSDAQKVKKPLLFAWDVLIEMPPKRARAFTHYARFLHTTVFAPYGISVTWFIKSVLELPDSVVVPSALFMPYVSEASSHTPFIAKKTGTRYEPWVDDKDYDPQSKRYPKLFDVDDFLRRSDAY